VTTALEEPSTASTSTAAQWWRRWRTAIAAGLVVVLAGVAYSLIGLSRHQGDLDPDSPTQGGSRAVAHLLRDQGVDVRRTQGVASTAALAGPGEAVVVVAPDVLSVEQAEELRSTGADLVVVGAADSRVVGAFLPGATVEGSVDVGTRAAVCDLPAATLSGPATTGGETYRVESATTCYQDSVVSVTEDSGRVVTLIGTGVPLRNDHLVKQGNAALAMNLLGNRSRLVWAMPSLEDSATEPRQTLSDLLPGWVAPAAVQLGLAIILVALWRARRLGPVVEEPLPIVVRAAEVTEGRARLYRRAKARGRAAAELRTATLRRVAPLVGFVGDASSADPHRLAAAVAARAGADEPEVFGLLYGGVPADEAALVKLADRLDRIEEEVRRS
jgi:hypothetical protein